MFCIRVGFLSSPSSCDDPSQLSGDPLEGLHPEGGGLTCVFFLSTKCHVCFCQLNQPVSTNHIVSSSRQSIWASGTERRLPVRETQPSEQLEGIYEKEEPGRAQSCYLPLKPVDTFHHKDKHVTVSSSREWRETSQLQVTLLDSRGSCGLCSA